MIPLTYFVKFALVGKVNLEGGVCIAEQTAFMGLVPEAALVLTAGVQEEGIIVFPPLPAGVVFIVGLELASE